MKKILVIILASVLSLSVMAAKSSPDERSRAELAQTIQEFSSDPDIDVVEIGSLGTSLLKTIAKWGAIGDKDMQMAVKLMKNLKKISIVDYSSCKQDVKDNFTRKVSGLLSQDNLLMEAKDGGDSMKIYATPDKSGDNLKDIILFSPDNQALICLFGSVSMDAVAKIIAEND